MLIVIALYLVHPGAADEVEEILGRHAATSAAEDGCLQFTAHRSVDDPDRFALYEAYADEAAFVKHRSTRHFRENIEEMVAPLLVERTWSRFVVIGADPGTSRR